MDLVKIGFQINANGLKDANVEVDKLLTKVTRVSSKSINLKVKLDNSIQTVKKTLSDVEKIKNNLSALNIKVSMVGYSQVKANLEKLEALKKSVKDIQVRFTTIGNVNKIRDDFIKLKNKIITVKVVTSTAQLDNLKKKLDSIKNKTIRFNINLPKSSEVEKLGKALDKLTNKKVKIEVTLTPDLTTVKEYANALDRIRSSRTTTNTNLGGSGGGGSGGRASSTLLDQAIGIAKYAALSAAIYGVMTATTNLAVATVKMADEYTAIQNRMKLYVKDADILVDVNQKLASYSMENNVGLRETATLFARLAPPMQRLGRSTEDITTVVDAFGKSMRIGGATAMEAASATIQFSQAMASGKLAGDEFRSISEASPRFLQAIAEGSGIAAAKLKEMSAAGLLTTKVITEALIKSYGKLSDENSRLGITLEQGANAIKTAFTVAIGEFNEGAGITRFFGESLMDLAISFKELSTSAKANGEAFKQWISDNENNIALLGKTAILVASIMVGKLVASFTAVMLAAITVRVQTLALNASILLMGNTARSVTGLMNGLAVAISRISFAGWVGIAATVASVVLGFKAFKESTVDANNELVSHNKYVAMTTEELKALGVVQRDLAKFKLNMDLSEAEKNVKSAKDEMVKALDDIIYKWDFIKKAGDNGFVEQYDAIIAGVKSGQTSYDQAIKQLSELGAVTPETAKELSKMAGEYDKTVDSMLPLVKVLDTLGIKHKITKDATANGKTENELYKKGLDDLKSSAIDAGDAIGGLASKYKQAAEVLAGGIKVGKITGIRDQSIAEDIYKDANDAANNLKGRLIFNNPKGITAEGLIQSGMYDDTIAQGKEVLKLRQQSADFFKKETATKKEDINNFHEQLTLAQEYVKLLNQGVDLDVAKIASTKEYAKWYGTNLDMAKSLVAIDKQRAEIEKQRQEQEQKREAKKQGYKTVIDDLEAMKNKSKFITEGFLPSVAEKSASLGFTPDAAGIQYAQKATTLELEKQADAYRNSAIEKRNIFELTKSGKTVEQAQIDNLLYTNKHLLPEQITLLEQIKELQVADRREDTRQKVANDSNAMLRQAAVYSYMQNNNLGDIANSYDMINKSEVQHLNSWKDIVQAVKDYNDYLVNQKANPLGDFSNIDFDVFGDFGNPFESALSGLNLLLGGADALKEKYDQRYAALDQQMKDAADDQESLDRIALVRESLKKKEIVDQTKLRQEQITSALKGVKSLFGEESKGYKVISKLEKAYQASQVAFQIWKNREKIKEFAIEVAGHIKTAASYISTTASKIAAEGGLNIVKGIGAILSAAQQAGPLAFVGFAAMAALVAGLGVSLAGGSSSGGEYVDTSNQGTGTVFGDSEAQSASIANSIDLLSENSDLMLPLTSAMLRSLKNIESNIGGVTNLILRQATGGEGFNIQEGFNQNGFGKALANPTVGGLGGLLGGGALGATFGVSTLMSGLGMGAMGALAIAGPIGLAVGALLGPILGKALGGLFGSKTTIKGQGLFGGAQSLGDILSGGFDLQEYVDVEVKKKSFGITTSTKNMTQFAEANKELEKQFTLIFGGFYDSILSATDILGANADEVKTKLENAIINIGKIDLKGLNGEQIQEKLEAVFGAAADSIARAATNEVTYVTETVQQPIKALFGKVKVGYRTVTQTVAVVTNVFDDFQKVGEGFFETIVRVATGVEQAAYFTDRLNVTAIKYVDIINKQGDVAAEMVRQSVLLVEGNNNINGGFYDLVNTFEGSAEELTNFIFTLRDLQDQLFMTGKDADYLTSAMILGAGGLDSLASGLDAYFEMLSPAEQAAELTRRLTNEFAIFGKKLPSDVKAFRDLVSSIDISTEAGQKLYGQILALAPEFNDLQDSLDKANSEVNALVQSLRDLAEEARKARGETEQPRNLAYTRSQFEQASVLAMQGDIASAEKLLTLGKDLMGLSKTYSVSGSEYARDLALIQRAATVSADIQEQGLGTSISTTLTPSSGTTTTPIVNTNNTSTDAKLDALSEKLEAGLFAIAKYTQDSASRLERWDDGGRMMVGIQPENGDAPVPVVVTP